MTLSMFLTEICSKKTLSNLSRLHHHSLVKVFIPSYLSAVNSKTNKMVEFEEYMAMFFLTLFTMVLRRRILRMRQAWTRRLWSRAWSQRMRSRSCFKTLVTELTDEDLREYKNYMRTNKDKFDILLAFFKLMCFYYIDLDSKIFW
jgi:hypothetical protein